MSTLQTAALPQLPAAVTVEPSVGIFGAPCIRIGVLPQLATREELTESKELIYWLASTALMRERANLPPDFQREHPGVHRPIDGRMMEMGVSLFVSLVGDCEVSIQIDVPGVSTASLRRSFDRVFSEMLDQVDGARPYATEGER